MTLVELTTRPLPQGAGRKADHLAWLAHQGIVVPSGWVIPSGVSIAGLALAAHVPAGQIGRHVGHRLMLPSG